MISAKIGILENTDTGACRTRLLGEEYVYAGGAGMHVKVKCVICGYETIQVVWCHWYGYYTKMPQIWICDDHRNDWQ